MRSGGSRGAVERGGTGAAPLSRSVRLPRGTLALVVALLLAACGPPPPDDARSLRARLARGEAEAVLARLGPAFERAQAAPGAEVELAELRRVQMFALAAAGRGEEALELLRAETGCRATEHVRVAELLVAHDSKAARDALRLGEGRFPGHAGAFAALAEQVHRDEGCGEIVTCTFGYVGGGQRCSVNIEYEDGCTVRY